MPSLKEYVLTLRKYNPTIEDRTLKIYLLKAGWPVKDVENVFAELASGSASAPAAMSAPMASSAIPVSKPIPPATPSEPHTIEIAPPEVMSPVQRPAAQPPISRPTPPPVSTPSKVASVPPIPAFIPPPPIAPIQKIDIKEISRSDIPGQINFSTKGSTMPAQNSSQNPPRIPSHGSNQFQGQSSSPKKIDPIKPKFSYNEIIGNQQSKPTPAPVTPPVPAPIPVQTPSPVSVQVPTAAPASIPAPSPAGTPVPISVVPPRPVSTPTLTPAPSTPFAAKIAAKKESKSKTKIFILWLIVLVLLFGIAFAYYRFVHGIYVFAKPPLTETDMLRSFADKLDDINSAEYVAEVQLTAKQRPTDFEIFPRATEFPEAPLDSIFIETLAAIPANTSLNLEIASLYQKQRTDNQGKWNIKGNYSDGGAAMAVDVESRRIGNTKYVKFNEFPEMLLDVKGIKGEWLSMSKEDAANVSSVVPFWMIQDIEGMAHEEGPADIDVSKQYIRLMEMANNDAVFQVINTPTKVVKPAPNWYTPPTVVYEYELKADLERFRTLITKADTVLGKEFGADSIIKLSEEDKLYLASDIFAKQFAYLSKNGSLKISVNKYGSPVALNYYAKIAPGAVSYVEGDTVLDASDSVEGSSVAVDHDAQIDLLVGISFRNINKNNPVEEPDVKMSLTEAYLKATGQDPKILALKNTLSDVMNLQVDISLYQQDHGGNTPNSLADLMTPVASAAIGEENGENSTASSTSAANMMSITASAAGLHNPPAAYTYKKTGKTTYALEYNIDMPAVPEKFHELSTYFIGFDTAGVGASGSARAMQYLKFINGKNTATEKTVSVEADKLKRTDGDRDRVSNALEEYLGTDPIKADTDADGTNDYDELRKGGNPTGPGSWDRPALD